MDMLQVLREEATTRFSSAAEVDAFMEGFEKTAAFSGWGHALGEAGIDLGGHAVGSVINGVIQNHNAAQIHWGPMAAKAGMGILGGLAAAAVIKGLYSAGGAIDNNQLKSKFEAALAQVIQSNKIVKNANPTKVTEYAKTIFGFAPHVASDPNLLSSLLANSVLGEGVDLMTIKSCVDLEGRYKENNNASGPLPSFKPA